MLKDALNDVAIRKAKPQAKPYKLADGRGMYLLVNATGKYWRFDYRMDAKRKTLALGCYPDVTLSQARQRRGAARQQIADGIDPGAVRKAQKQAAGERRANSFEVIAREWHSKQAPTWAISNSDKIIKLLERDLFPWLGTQPIGDLPATELLATLRRIESRGAIETAHRALQICGKVFRYAIATKRAERDISADLKDALPSEITQHRAAITAPNEIAGLLRAIEGYQGTFVVQCALRLAPLVFVRPGELRQAQWDEMDLDAALWAIPAERMKAKREHRIPLPRQAVELLRKQPRIVGAELVFPSSRNTPLSDMTLTAVMRRLKRTEVPHGWRSTFRDWVGDCTDYPSELAEIALAHSVGSKVEQAYRRGDMLEKRRPLMQEWADFLTQNP